MRDGALQADPHALQEGDLARAARPRRVASRQLVGFAERARKDGLLALEEEIEAIDDAVHPQGHAARRRRHRPRPAARDPRGRDRGDGRPPQGQRSRVFEKAGGFAPTIGVLGTVIALVHVLGNLAAPETLGPVDRRARSSRRSTASARPTSSSCPVGYRLQTLSPRRSHERTLVLEGILAIQAGDNPRVVQEKLLSFLAPAERDAVETGDGQARRSTPSTAARGAARGRLGRLMARPQPAAAQEARGDHEEHVDERWLVTYADMMTLLVALFMVLFSISSVNKSKFESLQRSLQDAFSGQDPARRQGASRRPAARRTSRRRRASPPESSLQPNEGRRRTPGGHGRVRPSGASRGAAASRSCKRKIDARRRRAGPVGQGQDDGHRRRPA